ncbi:hypothetical protein P175DRAFT_0529381 [Aspergillus ochraceoroseus IBT 24754]|uniref:Uncharacterized protein n=2 Tax=Aspergillus ochraceoroseus TaxID=138278 RepID=A0A2T5M1B9_9EURO|nr:uncharacterized protein P175DRAFT_0529381 [Aspergillus ochraceoroseus IBT 24754]KKK23488.1 hypothetical protein AOCH_001469 [Aspergillus ochraceoroseus]PTU22331.1 hypothetical protein P175DRAFT_0529381 [Aspergillus ochraceoroseus IBT 24754]
MALVWLITGTSSGFGTEFVKEALARGDKVIATARNVARISHLAELGASTLALDITAPQRDLDAKAAEAIAIHGRVDVLVNNAGYGHFGTLEDMRDDEYATQFATNLFGTLNTTRAFLPHFRARASATIVTMGSMASWQTWPTIGAYSASKAALRLATDALRLEVSSLGIRTLLVEPGQFRTEILTARNSVFMQTGVPAYEAITRGVFDTFQNAAGKERGDARKGAARIVDIVRGENGAAGREWPRTAAVPLGQDAVDRIRTSCEETLRMLSEWEDVVTGTDLDSWTP